MSAADASTVTVGGREVPRLGFGAMRLPGPGVWGPPRDHAEAVRVLRRAVELGVRVIDTAWYYGPEVAHLLIAEALHPYPADLVLVTKLGGRRTEDRHWHAAIRPDELRAGCEADLRLLRIDSIPVTHLRWMDSDAPADASFDDALATMLDLQREGKIEHIGLSSVSEAQLDRALEATPIVTVSNLYSVHQRRDDAMVDRCTRGGIAYLPFFPLDMGRLADPADAVARVAQRHGVSPVRVGIAWLLARSPVMLPIPGTSSVAHLEDNVAAAELQLTDDDLAELDAI